MTSGEPDLRTYEGRTVAGRYVLREWIGGGGFGAVFRSEQHILGRPVRSVACKLSRRGGMTEETAQELFTDVLLLAEAMDAMTDAEARRHLVHVYDGGVAKDAGGRAFLVMEYIQGATLASEFSEFQRVPASLMLKWARQICVALRGLHSLVPPLLHRDLKPDNVLLGTDRTVRLIDFGLAARLLEQGYVPGTAGTCQYMAPETAQGESVPASDLYSLGLLIYEGLTGRHAYAHIVPPPDLPEAALSTWLQAQKRGAPAVPPSALNNSVSREVDALVMRCLELDPMRRFRSAEEVLEALDRLDSAPPPAAPGEKALAEAQRLRATGDARGAVAVIERCLDVERPSPAVRYALLRELAAAHREPGGRGAAAAAQQLADAWELVCSSAVLRSRTERVELLVQVAEAFRAAGNIFQVNHYEHLCRAERGRR